MKKNFTTFMALMASMLISAHCFAQDSLVPFDAHSSIWGGMFAPQSPEGLDWALNAGGTLIREIRGFATDHLGSVRALGRTSQDPLATKYPGISPYSYCAGNPVNLVDPDGAMTDDFFFDENHNYKEKIKTDLPHRIVIQNKDDNIIVKFADPINDPKMISSKTKLITPSYQEINDALDMSGATNPDNHGLINGSLYLLKHSDSSELESDGALDFV